MAPVWDCQANQPVKFTRSRRGNFLSQIISRESAMPADDHSSSDGKDNEDASDEEKGYWDGSMYHQQFTKSLREKQQKEATLADQTQVFKPDETYLKLRPGTKFALMTER